PDRPAAIARELTKRFEETVRGPIGELAARLAGAEARGEHVIVVGAAPRAAAVDDETLEQAVTDAFSTGASARDVATRVARDLGVPRRRAYDAALRVRPTRS